MFCSAQIRNLSAVMIKEETSGGLVLCFEGSLLAGYVVPDIRWPWGAGLVSLFQLECSLHVICT